MKTYRCYFLVSILIMLLLNISETSAQQLIYQPVNPSFGGSPLNGNWLLQSAQLQDLTTDPSAEETTSDPLEDFKSSLNRTVLNQISKQISDQLFGEEGLTPGEYAFGDFILNVTETANGLNIVIFDITTGNETTIFLPYP